VNRFHSHLEREMGGGLHNSVRAFGTHSDVLRRSGRIAGTATPARPFEP
jgi:hypothetical protein